MPAMIPPKRAVENNGPTAIDCPMACQNPVESWAKALRRVIIFLPSSPGPFGPRKGYCILLSCSADRR
jgi:hypothetical protein